jgi:Holliday junction resolvasome RuvABC DNA-binding subunit
MAQSMPMGGVLSDATEALMALGYDKNTVLSALKGVDTKGADAGTLIRLALKKLAR